LGPLREVGFEKMRDASIRIFELQIPKPFAPSSDFDKLCTTFTEFLQALAGRLSPITSHLLLPDGESDRKGEVAMITQPSFASHQL
ncbi:unnamed protein product, partial [Citrullus colocynthis]